MNKFSKPEIAENIAQLVTAQHSDLNELAEMIYQDCLALAEHEKAQEIIDEKIDALEKSLQKIIVEERDAQTGKPKHSNDTARKSELALRVSEHKPLKMLKADRLNAIETGKQLQAKIEFKRNRLRIGEKILGFFAQS